MKTRLVDEIKPCDLCGAVKDSYYDAPTVGGLWANLCPKCFEKHGSPTIGTCFKKRDREAIVKKLGDTTGQILDGEELSNLESIVMDGDREIGCPNCGEVRAVEPDASYKFICEGCGSEVRCPCLPF